MNIKRVIPRILIYTALIAMSIACLFPLYWLVRSSFMSSDEIFSLPMKWFPDEIKFDNYIGAFSKHPFHLFFLNTMFVVVSCVVGNVLSSSFVAFGFARISFKGKKFWFALMISTLMLPSTALLVPQFIGWNSLGAYNTHWPLIIPTFLGNGFFVFMLRQFYLGIPRDYDEAAIVDGAGYFTIYRKIILPLSKPALTTVGVFTFMSAWNDFLAPLVYLRDTEMYTLALGLKLFIGQYAVDWSMMMAASALTILPMIIVFFFAQKRFIEGIAFSGLKG